jgi:cell division protein FtsI/penicillin-binding protein 2/beta-lactamase regulating signal transducer with metallopeptidase domain
MVYGKLQRTGAVQDAVATQSSLIFIMNTSTFLDLLSHTALKGSAVLFAALLLGLVLRRTAAARRYALWITAIATLAVLPLAMWALPAWRVLPNATSEMDWPVMEEPMVSDHAAPVLPVANHGVTLPAAKSEVPLPAEAVAEPAFSWNISWQDVVVTLPVVWLFIAGLLLLRLGWSAWCLRRLEQHLQPGSCDQVAEIAREIGLRRLPQLWLGATDAVPMVWGVLKPRLLLPQGFETWSRQKKRGVLLHELAHLKRGDPLALWAAQWVKALHWFNPLVWLTFRQLRADQERACDDAVLLHGVRASDYAQSLLDLSRHNRLAPGLALCALTITRCAPVEARVKAILDPKGRREGLTLRWLAGLAGGALLITLPVAMLHAIEGPVLRGRILDRNGVVLAESTTEKVRVYPLKTLAAHVVGYTQRSSPDDARLRNGAGIERKEDAALEAGNDVTLTFDARIQALTLRAMKEGSVERGAAVILDPRTGEILASVSLPSFDPNLFIPSISFKNWDRYLKDQDHTLLNRAVKGYVPGAAYIPLTALAGIAAGVGDSKFTCEGKVIYGNNTMQCWIQRQNDGRHGELGMRSAFVASCNCFWYQFGNAAGIEQIEAMSQKIGFGARYGILDDENPGLLPSPTWLAQNHPKERWSTGFTANTSIGQGFMLATPLQLAVLAATVGNSGKVPQPSLLKKAGATAWRADLSGEGLDIPQLEFLRDAMRLVVNGDNGTGKAARSERVVIAGRTGTAQNWRIVDKKRVEDNNAWFIGFAPFDKPTLAFAILKQGGKSGGSDCAPIAKRIVEEALALSADGSGEVKPVEEKSAAVQAPFDFNGAEISREIKLLEAELKISFKEFKIGNGQVTIFCEASEMDEAVKLLKRLGEIGERRQVKWSFPYPRSLENDRVGFRASGVYQPSQSNTEEGSKKAKGALQSLRSFKKTTAKVIGRSSGSLVINIGSLDGVVANSPVVTSVGLVGKTDTPEPYFTKVILLTDELCRVSAKVEGTQEQGILNGEKMVREVSPQLHLRFLSRQGKIDSGSRVSSSGEGGVFPAGLFLGRVKQFKSGDISGEALVEPAVDFSTLDRVFVIEMKAEAPVQEAPAPAKSADQAQLRQPSDAAVRMKPALANQWAYLKKAGLLADLPAEAQPFDTGESEERGMKSGRQFRFDVSRAAGHRWLLASVYRSKNVDEASLQWPEPPEAFQRTYLAAGHCTISILSSDGEHLIIIVSQAKPSISRSLTQSEAMPTLDVALQTLRPTISSQKVRLPTFRPQPGQRRLQAPASSSAPTLEMPFPLNRLHGDLSAESEKALRRSLGSGSRMQQALWVRASQER